MPNDTHDPVERMVTDLRSLARKVRSAHLRADRWQRYAEALEDERDAALDRLSAVRALLDQPGHISPDDLRAALAEEPPA